MSEVPLPEIHLLCYHEPDLEVFKTARKQYPSLDSIPFTYHTGSLKFLDPALRFDVIVSPANSYGRMDGGFDDALSRVFSPRGEYLALTHAVQSKLYEEWRGFAPPGTCTLVPFSLAKEGQAPAWGCPIIAVCPTMRQPEPIPWDREVVYECMWSLLCELDKWNERHSERERIGSFLMTPLATGTGGVSAEKWAAQVLLALKHFVEARADRAKWSRLEIPQIQDLCKEVADTHKI
ncbi:MAG: hypothetical protein MMC23_003873 [Stictis urceolatum]|nr:hypothetical protein [Stictis urceolata]